MPFMENEIYLVELPFKGYTQNSAYPDEQGVYRARYTGKLRMTQGDRVLQEATPDITLDQYLAERPEMNLVKMTWEELEPIVEDFNNNFKTTPKEIDADRFQEMLEVLPPCKWGTVAGAEVFHVSERLRGNLVSWFIRKGSRYFEMVQDASITKDALTTIIIAI